MDWSDLPLSRSVVDRASARRNEPELVERMLADPRTRVVLVRRGLVATVPHTTVPHTTEPNTTVPHTMEPRPTATPPADGTVALTLLPVNDLVGVGAGPQDWMFLGEDPDGSAYLGLSVPESEDVADIEGIAGRDPARDLVAGREWTSLRTVGAELSGRDVGLATTAVALAAWHAHHACCPRCGARTVVEKAGWVRRCPQDGSEHYPRTDPAVIMAVVDAEDRLLLGHAAQWTPGRFSTLAGYVEPGEPIEQAVRREVGEEVGVEVGHVTYVASQPWPFPASLMLGFRARALTTTLTVDGEEVTEARWFTRPELAAAVGDRTVVLPSRTSIARALIEDWFGTEVVEPDDASAW